MTENTPHVMGVGRMADNQQALLVSLDQRPTDDDLRSIHDYLRSWPVTQELAVNPSDDRARRLGVYAPYFRNRDPQYTDAEWRFYPNNFGGAIIFREPHGKASRQLFGHISPTLNHVHTGTLDVIDHDQVRIIARLMCAAPNLLAVLQAVEHTLSVHGHVDAETGLHLRIHHAIKNATGAA